MANVVDPAHLLPVHVLRTRPGGVCIASAVRDIGRVPLEVDRLEQQRLVAIYLRSYEFCDAAVAGLSPAVLADEVVRRVPLPVPVPRIEPGWMLAGLEAFLEVGAPVEHRYVESTPLGPIEVSASAVVAVDWGDGSSGRFRDPGGPYPDGSIRHVFVDAGAYDVVVSLRWVARWRIGAVSGVIDSGLVTSATLTDFEVQQRQAVVTCTGVDCR